MVLIGRRGPVIALLAALAAAAALAGCNQSLFDNHVGGGSAGSGSDAGSDGPGVPTSCPAGCLGDAAADFDGTDTGTTHVWRYLEDQGRVWKAMTLNTSTSTMMGQIDPANRITTCKTRKDAPACVELPNALLMSSGATSPIDPAIEFTTPRDMPAQVIELNLRAYLASGADQTIRIYRNSHEDLLFISPLTATNHVESGGITVDALPGDRFLVAISGTAAASEVGLQFYVSATEKAFPNRCQLALPFTGVDTTTTTTTQDPCSQYTVTSFVFNTPPTTSTPVPMVAGSGPYTEQMPGISVGSGVYLERGGQPPDNVIDWSRGVTVQLWTRPTMLGPTTTEQYLFSDFDPDTCGGFDLSVGSLGGTNLHLNLSGCIDPNPSGPRTGMISPSPAFPADGGWHFIRVVRNAAGFDLCIDGGYVASLPVLPGPISTHNQLVLGRQYSANQALFVGGLDDVRVFTGALPCR